MFNLYTDGAVSKQPKDSGGPGGWAVAVYKRSGKYDTLGEYSGCFSGKEKYTTIGRMELLALVVALEWLTKHNLEGTIYSDSEYCVSGYTKWLKGWKAKGWKKSDGKPPEHVDLWKRADACKVSPVTKVKGHSDNEGNNKADAIACVERDEAIMMDF